MVNGQKLYVIRYVKKNVKIVNTTAYNYNSINFENNDYCNVNFFYFWKNIRLNLGSIEISKKSISSQIQMRDFDRVKLT